MEFTWVQEGGSRREPGIPGGTGKPGLSSKDRKEA